MVRATAALVTVVTALTISVLPSGDEPLEGGPLVAAEMNRLSFARAAGTTFTYSVPVAVNRGDEPARIAAVALERPTAGLRVVGVLVAGPRRELEFVTGDVTFPPQLRDLHPAAGYAVARGRGTELVLGLTVPRRGRYVMHGVRLDYTVGGRRYRRLLPNTLAVCTDASRPCPLGPDARGETIQDGKTKVIA